MTFLRPHLAAISNTAVLIFLLKLLAKFDGNLCAGNLLLASPSIVHQVYCWDWGCTIPARRGIILFIGLTRTCPGKRQFNTIHVECQVIININFNYPFQIRIVASCATAVRQATFSQYIAYLTAALLACRPKLQPRPKSKPNHKPKPSAVQVVLRDGKFEHNHSCTNQTALAANQTTCFIKTGFVNF